MFTKSFGFPEEKNIEFTHYVRFVNLEQNQLAFLHGIPENFTLKVTLSKLYWRLFFLSLPACVQKRTEMADTMNFGPEW